LRHCGHAVRVTRNGPDTIAGCRVELPDVVLLDIGLPKLNLKQANAVREFSRAARRGPRARQQWAA
jgi:CheY-like chemotaxis protein